MKEPEILAVRELPPAMAEPAGDAVGRTWRKVVNAQRGRTARPVVRRWLIPAAAALAIGAVALSAALWLRGGSGSEFQPAQSTTAMDVRQALAQLTAASAQAGPAAAPMVDQVVHVRIDGWAASFRGSDNQGEMQQQIRELWLDPQGLIALQITDGSTSMMDGPKGDRAGNIAQGQQYLAENGPTFYSATPQWLANLPTDPAALYAVLQQTVQTNKWSQAHNIWNMMMSFSTNGDLLLSPANRTALFGAYAHIDGLRAETVVIGGETFIGLRHNESGSGDEVLFDPATGRAAGVRTLWAGDLTLTPAEGQPSIDGGVTYQAFFEQELVARSLIP